MVAARSPAAWTDRPPNLEGLDFGAMVRRFRVRAGLSQNQLARAAGVDPAYINRIERAKLGQGSVPSRRVVVGIWDALETTVEDRERLLVAAGHCPETVLRAGGWDAYTRAIRQNILTAIDALETALTVPPDAPEQ